MSRFVVAVVAENATTERVVAIMVAYHATYLARYGKMLFQIYDNSVLVEKRRLIEPMRQVSVKLAIRRHPNLLSADPRTSVNRVLFCPLVHYLLVIY